MKKINLIINKKEKEKGEKRVIRIVFINL